MNRRQIRESVFKLLFRMEFHKDANGYSQEDIKEQLGMFEYEIKAEKGILEEINEETLAEDIEEKDRFDQAMKYISEKYSDIMDHITEIDLAINDISSGWKTTRMAKVDLCILRLAVYEMRFEEDIPFKVSINEAVELAKKYGSDDSASFVNGVLAKFVK